DTKGLKANQNNARGAVDPPAPTKQKTLLDDVILTFSSPMAWLLIVALVITWSGVAIVLFDLLNYNTLAGLPPPSAIAKRALRARGKQEAVESTDWLEMIWTMAASLVAPDEEEEEGIHQLTEPLTCKKTPPHAE
uniref:Triadin n=1 Tax=Cyclopterus lumpus TaxID=8103 RepID=A0A8C3AYN8_CYCLU